MPALKDLTEQRFGRLKVIKYAGKKQIGKRKKYYVNLWECECDCGNRIITTGDHLHSKSTSSCGCLNTEKRQERCRKFVKDLKDKQFGRLKVIEKTDKRKNGHVVWLCECSCGNEVYISSDSLQSGNTQSCGCLHKELLIERSTTHGLTGTKEYMRILNNKRRERSMLYDSEWTLEMELALKKLQVSCVICGSTENLSVDHVLPLSKGYGLKPGNAVVLCQHHNCSKHSKNLFELPLEWQASLIWNAFKFADYWNKLELNI